MMHLLRATTTAFSVAGVFAIGVHSAAYVTPKHSSAPAPAMHATITVKMTGDAKGYRFEPAIVNAKVGDQITFTNVMGGPHDVTFKSDEIPAGTAAALQADMPKAAGPLTSPLFETDGESWTMSTEGLKPGTYPFYCMPHAPLGMKGQLVIE
ncbi:MAG: plastocyanin/azurin family copper-binding protein [Gemmatimonadaceae bacterium]